jgi:large subunit ribosomal protein L35e
MVKLKSEELRGKSKAALSEQLDGQKYELLSIRSSKYNKSKNNLPKIKMVRRNLARIITEIRRKQKEAIEKEYINRKYRPLDLRKKKTRALRRKLTKKPVLTSNKNRHFPKIR